MGPSMGPFNAWPFQFRQSDINFFKDGSGYRHFNWNRDGDRDLVCSWNNVDWAVNV